jgi:sigma-B regulation protein RsbU (phosphoserine phosphatase)
MGSAQPIRILLCSQEPARIEDLRLALEVPGRVIEWCNVTGPEPANMDVYEAIILEGSENGSALEFCNRIRTQLGDCFVPLLVVGDAQSPSGRVAALEAGADAFLARPFGSGELCGQVHALMRIKERHDRLMERAAEMQHTNKRLAQAHHRVSQELELARRIQFSFLPQTLPQVPKARFAVHYRPCGRVGGDFYDMFRLDEAHVGFYVADAMGHGVPASLLTMFLKKGVRAKEIYHNDYRLVPPEEVLQRLNLELVEQGLAENSFITMVYGLFNNQTGTLHFSRAGHPHPVYIPAAGSPELWKLPGSLLGVFNTNFSVQVCQLKPGDKALFYTDGTDTVSFEDHPEGTASFLSCVERHRDLPITGLVDEVSNDLLRQIEQKDDLTVLGIEITE